VLVTPLIGMAWRIRIKHESDLRTSAVHSRITRVTTIDSPIVMVLPANVNGIRHCFVEKW
jgi:hypothetical protein